MGLQLALGLVGALGCSHVPCLQLRIIHWQLHDSGPAHADGCNIHGAGVQPSTSHGPSMSRRLRAGSGMPRRPGHVTMLPSRQLLWELRHTSMQRSRNWAPP